MIRRELAKDPALKEENWERFLPQFKKRAAKKKKKAPPHFPQPSHLEAGRWPHVRVCLPFLMAVFLPPLESPHPPPSSGLH